MNCFKEYLFTISQTSNCGG